MFLLFVYAFFDAEKIYDIQLNNQYYVDVNQYSGYLPSNTYLYIRAAISEVTLKNFEFHLKVLHDYIQRFSIEVCGFLYYPTNNEIISQNTDCLALTSYEIEVDSNYVKYIYSFIANDDSQYLAIRFINLYPLYYLSFSLNTEEKKESMEFAILENAIPYKKEFQFDESLKNKTFFFFVF